MSFEKGTKTVTTPHTASSVAVVPYITYATIKALYDDICTAHPSLLLSDNDSNSNGNSSNSNGNITSKQFISIIKGHDTNHDYHHFLNFCRHVSHRLTCYKSQDQEKLKGDYKTNVVKTDGSQTVAVVKIGNDNEAAVITTNTKTVHSDSYNYIDSSLYKKRYYTVFTFLKLFIDSHGRCFYCEKEFELTLSGRFSACRFCECPFKDTDTRGSATNKHMRWSLERIDNNSGHYQNNCVLACLGCNLKRCTKNHKSFKLSQNLKIDKTM